MNRLLLAAAVLAASAALPALADSTRHYRGGHGYRHHHHSGPSLRFYGSWGYRPYAYYGPSWYYPAPVYVYPPYEPIVVERVYEPPLVYREPPPPVYREAPRPYPERPRAEARPTPPAPKVAAIAPPRMERYSLSARELFDFDQATLRMPQPKLDEIAEVLKRNPQFDRVTITGHTDHLGTDAYNLALSKRRAGAVKDYLVGRGVEPRRLETVGKGESEPVVQCGNSTGAELVKCLEPNRRVEVQQITVERSVPAS